MNSSFFCHPCKRAFASLDEYVKHNTKKQCIANYAIGRLNSQSSNESLFASTTTSDVTNEAITAAITGSNAAAATEPAPIESDETELVHSNISSPMAASSPMNEDIEQQLGNA